MPLSLLLVGSAMMLGLAAFGWLVLRVRRSLEARKIRARQRRGMAGQRRGRALLQRRGYQILAEEHPLSAEMMIDDQVYSYDVRIDFLVQKGRRTYGVEVKTGEQATNPLHRQTRRQLLEYSQLLAVDGLLLLDMEAEELMRIGFPAARRRSRGLLLLLLGVLVGTALTAALVGRLGAGSLH